MDLTNDRNFLPDINANTDRLVIAFYPRGSGGKFLMNCLGLSDQFALQDRSLAEHQLSGKLTKAAKLNLLIEKLSKIGQHWNDLEFGCLELFGDVCFKKNNIDFFDIKRHSRFFPIIRELSNSHIYFPTVMHDIFTLKNTLHHWPNAKVIRLICPDQFMDKYQRLSKKNVWNDIKGADWPSAAPETWEQYLQLPAFVKKELPTHGHAGAEILRQLLWESDKKQLDYETQKFLDQTLSCCSFLYQWNVDWYLDETSTIRELGKLYDLLGLNDFDENSISTFYQAYTAKLLELSQCTDQRF